VTPSEGSVEAVREVLESRWSCRAFLPTEVPRNTIDQIFGLAQRTASWCNTQPWHVHVTSGKTTERFAEGLTTHARQHESVSDFPLPADYVGVYRDRRREAGFMLYGSLGIPREDMEARTAQHFRNFKFFGAPHVALVSTDRNQGVYGAVDCGAYVANLLNVATAMGVASIPQAAIAMHSDYVREFFALPDDRLVVCAISFGYPDPADPVNGFRTTRAAPGEAVSYVDK
jgi:nitroreductase